MAQAALNSVATPEAPPSFRDYRPEQARKGDALANHEPYGPLTTTDMEGAGGPFCKWDSDIAAAKRRGNPQLAKRLQEARARINLAFGAAERVWVPTQSQAAIFRLRNRAVRDGVAILDLETRALGDERFGVLA